MPLSLLSCLKGVDDATFSGEINNTDSALGDLRLINGSAFAVGINQTGTSNTYVDCSVANLTFFPNVINKFLIAFGATPARATCGFCDISYKCSPGESLTIDFYALDTANTPADFEANIGIATTGSLSSQVCPSDGTYTYSSSAAFWQNYQKVTISGVEGTDSEYMKCP